MKEQNKRAWEKEKARQEGDEERLRKAKEKVREQKQRYRQANPEKLRERQQRWRQANPEKLREQKKRRWEREKRLRKADDERSREIKRKDRERQRRYRQAKKQSAQSQEADKARWRQYHEAHKEERNQARRERYYWQMGRPVPPPPSPLPCDCGVCLACGGWAVTWQPAWHARLKAFSAKKDQPPVALEDLPLDLLESEAETLSIASTSEIDSELGDRLETLLADESDSEVETGPATVPTRRSNRIAVMPAVSYQDWEEEENPMLNILKRKAQLHAEAEDRIVTRWELLDRRTERVDAIVEEMSVGVDPRHELDRFHAQMERQDTAMDVMVSEELFDFVDGQL